MRTGIDLWQPPEADYPPSPQSGFGSPVAGVDFPSIRYPIGFLGRNQKPRIRVQAVMQPIPKVPTE